MERVAGAPEGKEAGLPAGRVVEEGLSRHKEESNPSSLQEHMGRGIPLLLAYCLGCRAAQCRRPR